MLEVGDVGEGFVGGEERKVVGDGDGGDLKIDVGDDESVTMQIPSFFVIRRANGPSLRPDPPRCP